MEGRLQPQALELESGVLGSLLLGVETMSLVSDILQPRSFYDGRHTIIYECMLSLFKRNIRCDAMSVVQELKKNGQTESSGGAYFISQLANKESQQPEYHARIIQQKFLQRELIRICNETSAHCYDETADCFDLIGSHEKNLTEITKNVSIGSAAKTISQLWDEVYQKNKILLSKKGVFGVPSGFNNLDRITGGWQQPDLIIIAARPKMGKTSLVCNFMRNACVDFNIPVAMFSLEMSSIQIATRIFSLESDTSNTDFLRKGIEEDRMIYVADRCSRLVNSPLYIDDTPGISLFELRSKARRLKREKNIQLIVVDYLQLMTGEKGNKGNREQEISAISRGLKGLAKELEIPIIALSQLSRAVETRGGDKRPQLSDLRESGAIEQDADMVVFIHRPEYYGIMEDSEGKSTAGKAEIIFAAHRSGGVGTEQLNWIDYLTKFESIEENVLAEIKPKNNLKPNLTFESNKDDPF